MFVSEEANLRSEVSVFGVRSKVGVFVTPLRLSHIFDSARQQSKRAVERLHNQFLNHQPLALSSPFVANFALKARESALFLLPLFDTLQAAVTSVKSMHALATSFS